MLPDIWPGKKYNGHTNGCGSGKAAAETRSRSTAMDGKPLHFPGFLSSLALRLPAAFTQDRKLPSCLPHFWQLIQAFKGIAHSFPFA